jgi:hypothetical protein
VRSALHLAETILSLGFNLLIRRLLADPRWRRVVWVLLVVNELFGVARAFGYLMVTGV